MAMDRLTESVALTAWDVQPRPHAGAIHPTGEYDPCHAGVLREYQDAVRCADADQSRTHPAAS
jgi:hypothetical protein